MVSFLKREFPSTTPRRAASALLLLLLPGFSAFAAGGERIVAPPLWLTFPFVLFLLAIAVMPFIAAEWWRKYYPHVSICFAIGMIGAYRFLLGDPERMLHMGIDYFSFIVLIGSLFVVAGGMHISLKGYSTPARNVILLGIGALVSNFIGTTGASMVMIRPWLRNNKYRLHPYHVVFFIFLVSNIGGALTPIGDPPLFLGYLKGIPFFWVMENVWHIWLIATLLLLVLFWAIDERYYRKVPRHVRQELAAAGERTRLEGMHNGIFIAAIIGAVFVQNPPFLREGIMIAAAALSWFTTRRAIHDMNDFHFHPIREVAFLFAGIFATMAPALDWLELNSAQIGITAPGHYYWATGILSSVLDNAPTYLNFLSASIGLFVPPALLGEMQRLIAAHGGALASIPAAPDVARAIGALARYHPELLAAGAVPVADIQVSYLLGNHPLHVMAVSVAAVFFGAMTYIGNGPNFMVKSIAEHAGARVPGFFEYIWKYSAPLLLPIFFLVWLLYFSRGG